MKIFVHTLLAAALLLPAGLLAQESARNDYAPGMKPVDTASLLPVGKDPNMVKGAIYANPSRSASDRALDFIWRLTLEEKLAMTGGWNRFMTCGIPRLGIRPVSMGDASQGIRLQTALVKEHSTSFPGMLPLASTWNAELAARMGRSIGEECRALGVDLLLGPGVNMQRLSVGGRNFEYMGEDPLLTGTMASAYVSALQTTGVIATPKHFIGNDQDFCRHIASSDIDPRTLREIYLLPWEMLVKKAGVLGMMTGNNLVNGIPCPMQRDLISRIMRDEYGFRGVCMTDWQNSSYYESIQNQIITSGLSLLMPDNDTFRAWAEAQIASSSDRSAEIEAMLERMIYPTLYALFAAGIYDRPFSDPAMFDRFGEHKKAAAACAEESIVLLRNEKSILPIAPGKKILLTGEDEIHSGTGSGFVTGYDHVSYEDGLRAVYGDNLTCVEKADDRTVRAADVVLFRINKPTGEGRDVPFEGPEDQLSRLRQVLKLNKNVVVLISACNGLPTDWLKEAKGVLWCYFLGQERGTGLARVVSGQASPSGKLPFTLERSFADSPDPDFNFVAPGQRYWQGNNRYRSYWLGINPDDKIEGFSEYVKPRQNLSVPYDEGVFMGYRWYDKKAIPVVFPFGFGLSYTTFTYENIACDDRMRSEDKLLVTVTVRNTGKMAGKEIVQVYVSDPQSSVERPLKELKGFAKLSLRPGETGRATIELDARSFSFWDEATSAWKLEPGRFVIRAGGSSADLPLETTVDL